MKHFFTIILAIACATVLFLGNRHWNERTTVAMDDSPTRDDVTTGTTGITESEVIGNQHLDLAELTKNWPEKARERFNTTLKENKPFKVLFVGSSALGTETEGLSDLISTPIIEAYGEKSLELEIHTYDMTSKEFILGDKQQEIVSKNADFILLEPFTLKDNGEVTIEDSLSNLTELITSLSSENPNLTIMLMPPNPLHKATFYPVQVAELKEYAVDNQIPYLDHWSAWPDLESDEMLNYLTPESTPNAEGYKLWSAFILKFLINQ